MTSGDNLYARESCPACESVVLVTLISLPYADLSILEYLSVFYNLPVSECVRFPNESFTLYRCSHCTLIFQQSVPSSQFAAVLYGDWLSDEHLTGQGEDRGTLRYRSAVIQDASQLVALTGKRPDEVRVLDFGMGWAEWSSACIALGCIVYGYEIEPARQEHAGSIGVRTLGWEDIPNGAFDVINTEQVFEHLSEPLDALQHLRRGLAPDGLLKVSVPNAHHMRRRLKAMDWGAPKGSRRSLNPVAPLEHVNTFNRRSLLMMGTRADLEEFRLPLSAQYRFATNWTEPKTVAKNLLMPMLRSVVKNQNYIVFRPRGGKGNGFTV